MVDTCLSADRTADFLIHSKLYPVTPYFLKMGMDKVWTGLQVIDYQ